MVYILSDDLQPGLITYFPSLIKEETLLIKLLNDVFKADPKLLWKITAP